MAARPRTAQAIEPAFEFEDDFEGVTVPVIAGEELTDAEADEAIAQMVADMEKEMDELDAAVEEREALVGEKQLTPEREEDEKGFERRIYRALRKMRKAVLARVVARGRKETGYKAKPFGALFWKQMQDTWTAEMESSVTHLLKRGASAAVGGSSVPPEAKVVTLKRLGTIATRYADEWWKQLEKKTREKLRLALTDFIQSEQPLAELVSRLEPIFGRTRAENIAVTETTRLYTEGRRAAWAALGVKEVVWNTVNDDSVDPCATG